MSAAPHADPVREPVRAVRYVTPLREGGSLPGLMEADDDGLYVVKFRGAGQGLKALVAEVICAELAQALGLPVPRWTPIEVPVELAPAEPDEEVQHLLRASAGLNLGVDFLPGALDVGPMPVVEAALAGRILWFDALVANADRSWRNPNLLLWHRQPYLIDHGAALTFHHSWKPGRTDQLARYAEAPYSVADHALVECRPDVEAADRLAADVSWPQVVAAAVAAVPDEWLDQQFADPAAARAAYREYLFARLAARPRWVPELVAAAAAGARRDERGRRVSDRVVQGPPDWIGELRLGGSGR